jgi:hypothetical protein
VFYEDSMTIYCTNCLKEVGEASVLAALQTAFKESRSVIVKRAAQAAHHQHSESVHG